MLIALKLKLALACAAGLLGPIAVAPLVSKVATQGSSSPIAPQIVEIASGEFSYRASGDFTRAGQQAEAPLLSVRFNRPLSIMRHQVSSADYQLCVLDRACRALDRDVVVAADRPAVQVNWHDAEAYAAWLSRRTGKQYRLPTDEEWAYAAGGKFRDDGLPVDATNPAKRWISRYERETDRDLSDTAAHPFGTFGVNERGLLDLAGNVWEWTSTCFVRSELDRNSNISRSNANCGVRIAEGAHRAYVTDFIRDARAGGCAAGIPPANLGFRLVRENKSFLSMLSRRLNKALPGARS